MTISAEEIASPEAKVEMQLHILDGMADAWADEVDLVLMIKAATCPMDLNKNVPSDVKEKFRLRMEAQIDAVARQAFLEGAHRAICMIQDAYNPIVIEQRARIAALEAQLAEAVASEREECAKIAERDADWASFGMRQAVGSNPEIFESDPDERNITIYRAGICAGRSIAAVIRARSEQEGK